MSCLFCLKNYEKSELIEVFGELGTRFKVVEIVEQHFWFYEVLLKNNDSEGKKEQICNICWWKIENFHYFYCAVRENHSVKEKSVKSIEKNQSTEEIVVDLVSEDLKADKKLPVSPIKPQSTESSPKVLNETLNRSDLELKEIINELIPEELELSGIEKLLNTENNGAAEVSFGVFAVDMENSAVEKQKVEEKVEVENLRTEENQIVDAENQSAALKSTISKSSEKLKDQTPQETTKQKKPRKVLRRKDITKTKRSEFLENSPPLTRKRRRESSVSLTSPDNKKPRKWPLATKIFPRYYGKPIRMRKSKFLRSPDKTQDFSDNSMDVDDTEYEDVGKKLEKSGSRDDFCDSSAEIDTSKVENSIHEGAGKSIEQEQVSCDSSPIRKHRKIEPTYLQSPGLIFHSKKSEACEKLPQKESQICNTSGILFTVSESIIKDFLLKPLDFKSDLNLTSNLEAIQSDLENFETVNSESKTDFKGSSENLNEIATEKVSNENLETFESATNLKEFSDVYQDQSEIVKVEDTIESLSVSEEDLTEEKSKNIESIKSQDILNQDEEISNKSEDIPNDANVSSENEKNENTKVTKENIPELSKISVENTKEAILPSETAEINQVPDIDCSTSVNSVETTKPILCSDVLKNSVPSSNLETKNSDVTLRASVPSNKSTNSENISKIDLENIENPKDFQLTKTNQATTENVVTCQSENPENHKILELKKIVNENDIEMMEDEESNIALEDHQNIFKSEETESSNTNLSDESKPKRGSEITENLLNSECVLSNIPREFQPSMTISESIVKRSPEKAEESQSSNENLINIEEIEKVEMTDTEYSEKLETYKNKESLKTLNEIEINRNRQVDSSSTEETSKILDEPQLSENLIECKAKVSEEIKDVENHESENNQIVDEEENISSLTTENEAIYEGRKESGEPEAMEFEESNPAICVLKDLDIEETPITIELKDEDILSEKVIKTEYAKDTENDDLEKSLENKIDGKIENSAETIKEEVNKPEEVSTGVTDSLNGNTSSDMIMEVDSSKTLNESSEKPEEPIEDFKDLNENLEVSKEYLEETKKFLKESDKDLQNQRKSFEASEDHLGEDQVLQESNKFIKKHNESLEELNRILKEPSEVSLEPMKLSSKEINENSKELKGSSISLTENSKEINESLDSTTEISKETNKSDKDQSDSSDKVMKFSDETQNLEDINLEKNTSEGAVAENFKVKIMEKSIEDKKLESSQEIVEKKNLMEYHGNVKIISVEATNFMVTSNEKLEKSSKPENNEKEKLSNENVTVSLCDLEIVDTCVYIDLDNNGLEELKEGENASELENSIPRIESNKDLKVNSELNKLEATEKVSNINEKPENTEELLNENDTIKSEYQEIKKEKLEIPETEGNLNSENEESEEEFEFLIEMEDESENEDDNKVLVPQPRQEIKQEPIDYEETERANEIESEENYKLKEKKIPEIEIEKNDENDEKDSEREDSGDEIEIEMVDFEDEEEETKENHNLENLLKNFSESKAEKREETPENLKATESEKILRDMDTSSEENSDLEEYELQMMVLEEEMEENEEAEIENGIDEMEVVVEEEEEEANETNEKELEALKKKINLESNSNINLSFIPKTADGRMADEADNLIFQKCSRNCEECPHKFKNFRNVKNHYKIKHNVDGYLKCCNVKFTKKHLLINHIEMKHSSLNCIQCPKKFESKALLQKHIAVEHKKNEIQAANLKHHACDFCEEVFMNRIHLNIHTAKTHPNANFSCKSCEKKFNTKQALQKHSRTHMTFLTCEICKEKKDTWTEMNNHVKLHNLKILKCNICAIEVYSSDLLKFHKKEAHEKFKYKCEKCEFLTKTKRDLDDHVKAMHKNTSKFLQCPHCSKNYLSKSFLQRHLKTEHASSS